MWPVDPTTGWVAIDREGRGDAGVTVAFDVVHESAETLLPLVGLRAEALAADVRGAGLVYVTDAQGAGNKVTAVAFPESAGAVNTYPIAVLKQAKNPELARKFVDLVTGEAGQKVLSAAGFAKP
jgi:ABC-type glycerol-3-phosphate transport system substrate-binding protein